MFISDLKNRAGLTLIEVLVSASVLIIGLMAILVAAVALLKNTQFSKDFLIATSLAREAIEVVRNQKDQNLRSGRIFDYLDASTQLRDFDFAILEFNDTGGFDGEFKISESAQNWNDCVSSSSCQVNFFSTKGLYGNGTLDGQTGESSNFYRLVKIDPIYCLGNVPGSLIGNGDNFVCKADEIIGLKVTTRVGWYKSSDLKKVEISSSFYRP